MFSWRYLRSWSPLSRQRSNYNLFQRISLFKHSSIFRFHVDFSVLWKNLWLKRKYCPSQLDISRERETSRSSDNSINQEVCNVWLHTNVGHLETLFIIRSCIGIWFLSTYHEKQMNMLISLQIVRGIARAVAGSGLFIIGYSAQGSHEGGKDQTRR